MSFFYDNAADGKKYKITQNQEYEKYIQMYLDGGLEIDPEEKQLNHLLFTLELTNDEDGVVGAISAAYDHDEYVIKRVVVVKEYQGRNLGRLLVTEMLERLKKNGVEADLCALQASRGRVLGGYHLMEGMNPVYVAAFGGEERGPWL